MEEEVTEREKLEVLQDYLIAAKSGLEDRDWAVIQGALREFYNQMQGFLADSTLPKIGAPRSTLIATSEFVHDTRERLVECMEIRRLGLEETIKFYHLYERLETLQGNIGIILDRWYKG